jgi:hypothetical protein
LCWGPRPSRDRDLKYFQGRGRGLVASLKKYPIVNQRNFLDRDPTVGRDLIEHFILFHQAVYTGKFYEKFLGRDPENFSGHDVFPGRHRFLISGVWFPSITF